jgi:CheY-like chemotaxis protein
MKKILIVDDDPVILDLIGTKLSESGYEVLKAHDGIEAVRIARSEKPNLIILDLLMPIMGGNEFYRALRATPALADIPVLISTSDPLAGPACVPVVRKPVNLEHLLSSVAKLGRPATTSSH